MEILLNHIKSQKSSINKEKINKNINHDQDSDNEKIDIKKYNIKNKNKKSKDDDLSSDKIQRRIKVVEKLMSIEYPAQRSVKWFKMREGSITASDSGQSLNMNHYTAQFDFIVKKVFPTPFPDNFPCYNGKKYENIATMIYSFHNDVRVEEFGLILHPKYDFLAASPDGIVSKYKLDGKHKTNMVGRMLEIKCPTSRKLHHSGEIKGHICPLYYWIQIQNQLECCDLDQCDFLQCKLKEYPNRQSFIDDTDENTPYKSKSFKMEKGAVIQLVPKEKYGQIMDGDINDPAIDNDKYNKLIWGSAKWIYPPRIDMSPLDYDMWISETVQNLSENYPDFCLDRVYYWGLEDMTCDTVERERDWFADHIEKYKKIWNYVVYFREHKDKQEILARFIKTFNFKNDASLKDNANKRKNNSKIMKAIYYLYNEEDEIIEDDFADYIEQLVSKTKKIPEDKEEKHH